MQRKPLMMILLALSIWPLTGCVPALIAGTGAGVAVATDPRTSATYLDDSEIDMHASGRIATNYPASRVHVNVHSYDRNVLLTGQVPDEATKAQITALVQAMPDVNKVYNQLEIGAPTDFSSRSEDVYISTKVHARFINAGTIPMANVDVVTEHGVVYLMGIVTQAQGDEAARVARLTSGVKQVITLFEYH